MIDWAEGRHTRNRRLWVCLFLMVVLQVLWAGGWVACGRFSLVRWRVGERAHSVRPYGRFNEAFWLTGDGAPGRRALR